MMLEHASPRGRGPCSERTEPPKTEATKVKGARKIIRKRDYQQVGTQQAQGTPRAHPRQVDIGRTIGEWKLLKQPALTNINSRCRSAGHSQVKASVP